MDKNGNKDNALSWSALEYEERERSRDWFWALGIIVVTSSVASIIFNNYFLAVLLILSGILLGFFAIKKPEMITYELNNKGLKVKGRLYPYENMKSFWVQSEMMQNANQSTLLSIKPILFIKTSREFMPILEIPFEEELAQDIHTNMLAQEIKEEEMREHPSEKIMAALGF